MKRKEIHFAVDKELYEEFHRLFPARGEKTIFFTRLMRVAVEKEKDIFISSVWEEAKERYGES